jgi:hypothetical protein
MVDHDPHLRTYARFDRLVGARRVDERCAHRSEIRGATAHDRQAMNQRGRCEEAPARHTDNHAHSGRRASMMHRSRMQVLELIREIDMTSFFEALP